MKILFISDIFGKPGRKMVRNHLSNLVEKFQIDLVIANAENAAHGKGITNKIFNELNEYGIKYFTMGNHTWDKNEVVEILTDKNNVVRPANLSSDFFYSQTGKGSILFKFKNKKIRLTNLLGSTVNFYNRKTKVSNVINPFLFFEDFLEKNKNDADIHIVDFHAETTSEKNAFLRSFCGRVSAILGTHTHVPSNDYQIYNNTAYITDVGMTGPFDGIIGGLSQPILDKFYEKSKLFHLEVQKGLNQMCSVLLEIDDKTNAIKDFFPIILREDKIPSSAHMIQVKKK